MTARRPWWKRKRWWAAAALWLAVAFPLSSGPVAYAGIRDWLPNEVEDIYTPVTMNLPDTLWGYWLSYTTWWVELAAKHEKAAGNWAFQDDPAAHYPRAAATK